MNKTVYIYASNESCKFAGMVSNISIYQNLTFVEVSNSVHWYNILLPLVKEGLIQSIDTRDNCIKIEFYTKYVDKIEEIKE